MPALLHHPFVLGGAAVLALWLIGRLTGHVEGNRERRRSTGRGFALVAGCDEAVEELAEMVEFIREPERFERLGARTPRGALLVGPPGTGKTMLARAVAEEAGVAFLSANGSDFVDTYVGVGAKRIRELYEKARDLGRAIVFIDEIDALGRSRAQDRRDTASGSQTEHENTLIALLSELDGFSRSDVVTIGATNRPDVLDAALLRPGRLERRIEVPLPDRRGRGAILEVHTRNKPLGSDVDLDAVAGRTAGMSGADLERVTNEAALQAARRGCDEIDQFCFDRAVEYVAMGRPRHTRQVHERDRRITAWHEAGHCVAALVLEHADDPVSVSIVPRGAAGGVTWFGSDDRAFVTREEALDRLAVMLGGRAAEEIHLGGSCTQGAADDLLRATSLARDLVARLGMGSTSLQVGNGDDDATRAVVDELLHDARRRATAALHENAALLERIAEALLRDETLDSPAIDALRGRHRVRRHASRHVTRTWEHAGPTPVRARARAAVAVREPLRLRTRVGMRAGRLAALLLRRRRVPGT